MSSSSLGTIILEERKGGAQGGGAMQHLALVAPAAGREGDRSSAAAQGRHTFCSQNRSTTIFLLDGGIASQVRWRRSLQALSIT